MAVTSFVVCATMGAVIFPLLRGFSTRIVITFALGYSLVLYTVFIVRTFHVATGCGVGFVEMLLTHNGAFFILDGLAF